MLLAFTRVSDSRNSTSSNIRELKYTDLLPKSFLVIEKS